MRLTCPLKNTRGTVLTAEQRTINALHSATRVPAECGNSLPKTTFKVLRAGSRCARGGSARSPPQRWFSCTRSMTAQHDHPTALTPTGKGSVHPGTSHVPLSRAAGRGDGGVLGHDGSDGAGCSPDTVGRRDALSAAAADAAGTSARLPLTRACPSCAGFPTTPSTC